ncbi:hypothetical protein HBH61_178960 [Parastagonospora nodorum]|nr:hypothetical protein HBH61_178960 [Parastagonospora nodorum]
MVFAPRDPAGKDNELVAVTTTASERLPFSKMRSIALVAAVSAAPFLTTFNTQASIITLPTIGEALNIPTSRQQWIVSAYNLTFGCFLLLWGRLADIYGRRLIFLWGSSCFTIFAIVTPFIPNEIGFDVLRGLAGLAAAAMFPTALGILGTTFPPGKAKDLAFGCFGAGAPLGGVVGNIFGGVVSEYLSWKWVFWIFGIIAAAATIAGFFVIPLPPAQAEPSMRNTVDWVGGTLITVGLIILLFALSEGNDVGWSTPWVPTLIVVSLLIVVVFGVWQHYLETKTEKRPLMKTSIFKNRNFLWANVIMALFFASFNNFLVYATYWFQDYQGLSVIQTTLRFIPTGVTGILVALVTGYILSSVRGDYILTFSTTCVSVASLLFAIPIPDDTTYWAYGFPAMVLSVCGADTLFPVLTLFVAKSLPPEDASLGGALIMAVGQIGRSIGLAIATAVQTAILANEKGASVTDVGSEGYSSQHWDEGLKLSIRGAAWFNFAISLASTAVVVFFVRGIGIVGGKGKR